MGLASGAVYGLAGVGLVVTFKTSGVFNFAYGAQATIATFGLYYMSVRYGVPEDVAAVVCVLVLGPLMGLLLERLSRVIAVKSLALQVAATIGIVLTVEAAITLIYGQVYTSTIPPLFGSGGVVVGSVHITYDQIVTIAFAVFATIGLTIFLRTTRLGISMRAVVSDADLLGLSSISAVATRRWAWVIGATFAAASGILIAPGIPLDPTSITFLVIDAFGAAAIGAFTNLSLTFVGGLAIGVLSALSVNYLTTGLESGISPSLPFIALFLTLLFFRKKWLLVAPNLAKQARSVTWTAPAPLRLGSAVVALVVLLFVPQFVGIHLTDWTSMMSMVIFFLSLGLLVGRQARFLYVSWALLRSVLPVFRILQRGSTFLGCSRCFSPDW